ncbi:hypothetical protein [Hymenobacter cheonanensis]|uniref:hypothetical protein n=1 Tax=Hymenobacter sp. CA2-7 TaxID=3063993 RepID=UPI0027126CF5|nr:hypothetical protein [Hymenobacter sp. CA2-7]MDO7888247.1 hypothetical protein [Hymenobacter sp. CA2-7]
MTRFVTACLLPLLCLLSLPATSQPIRQLAPLVVRLDSGTVVRQRLVGIDTATYRSTRQYVATAGQLLLVRADRIAQLERDASLRDSVQTAYATELRRSQASQAATEADYQRMRAAARVALASPPRPPWLLDSRTYKAGAAGTVLGVLLKVFVFH